ncbi:MULTISPECIES: class I SAM-dependent methyltransferase [unclassified Caballeronia]|uniref:class I SAM-dependent methyltransferase n=1 Tax=unclassified Caballeronia TaxID=2646786 RepID=UPI002865345F|nr:MULTISPECIES: class I SAM-dependent methyltransferase [unclassified Caballeronia]MDR5771088.1 class I SAM-dependent methyltransferase [Caballeronia sp. LZ002]MDR5846525.1 class I SAM-dependent methyltransferase [Caballeronia sp. LZ003]
MSDTKTILDPCCGTRMFWFDPSNKAVLFGDARSETVTVVDRSHGKQDGERVLNVSPDIVMDFRAMEFADASFKLVVFDPPHLVRAGSKSWLAAKYGKLSCDWRDDLRRGFAECFRVLGPEGILIFKWNEVQIKVAEILTLTDQRPLFGHKSGKRADTHWICFMKAAACSPVTEKASGIK